MSAKISASQIIAVITDGLAPEPDVNALWLEGSRAAGTADAYSDIDLAINIKDGCADAVFAKIDELLSGLGELAAAFELPQPNPCMRHKVYHIHGSSAYLLIDCTLEDESRRFVFTKGAVLSVLFDKANVIRFHDLDLAKLRGTNLARLAEIEAAYHGYRPNVTKQYLRGSFLEAAGYYRRYVLDPLIEALRIAYAPTMTDYSIKHIYRHLPPNITSQLEDLFKVGSVGEFDSKLVHADALFAQTVARVRGLS
jgi:predicted nucleotidyltransferase